MCPGTLKTGSIFCCSCLQVDGSINGGRGWGGGAYKMRGL